MDNQYLNVILLCIALGIAFALYATVLIRQLIKQKNCPHKHKMMYVENVAATCERITTTCMDCGKTTTKIEC